ncbi:MAG TPA: heme NO-binding protein [Paracoccus sp.]|nr:heme NO-binding protein [Paracoccus sp. (in: a-proteobacteria)]
MQTLLDRAIGEFMREVYGIERWQDILDQMSQGLIDTGPDGAGYAGAMREAARRLAKPEADLFEDLGAWLARHEPIRRLLRFSGSNFRDFVMRLDELPDRAHMVVPELRMPSILIRQDDSNTVTIELTEAQAGWSPVLGGILRGMADDYGALGLILVEGDVITVRISDESFSEDRGFQLGDPYHAATASR